MNEAVFSMYTLKCFELGIIPIRNFNGEPVNISEALDLATQDEARKMKRKFRKLWRKSRKTKCRGARSGRVHQTLYKAALLEFDK
tara:strand:- start:129 stop:383 length:255 start_codon:yes stop_codon:yes gene_type:complete